MRYWEFNEMTRSAIYAIVVTCFKSPLLTLTANNFLPSCVFLPPVLQLAKASCSSALLTTRYFWALLNYKELNDMLSPQAFTDLLL